MQAETRPGATPDLTDALAPGPGAVGDRAGAARVWLRLLRPKHWIKNGFVLAPLFFSGAVTQPARVGAALVAFMAFSLVASGVYCLNDVVDREADRRHPDKRKRPVASGAISPTAATVLGSGLLLVGLSVGFVLAPGVGWALIAYLVLNLLYNVALKSIVLLDVFSIAAFFELRLLAGVAAIQVQPSVWLLLCGGLLALYLGFTKRLHELTLMGQDSFQNRPVLQHYDKGLLDQMASILLAVTVVSYIMYTLTSETAVRLGDDALAYSSVFVLYGVFRYLYLVHREERGGDPADTLLADPGLLVAVGLWVAYCSWAIYRFV